MEIFLIRVLQFMLAISLLVLLHEGGHFFFSKLFGVRVEKFYLFFNPWFHLFEFKPKKSDTTYGIGWLPLGGYCKISGMIDESFDTEQMKQPMQPWEFRTKPAWQRLLIMVGGVLVNFITALVIYSMILFAWGNEYVSLKDMHHGMKFNTEAKQLGFKDGDILVSTDQGELKTYGTDMFRALSVAKQVSVIRDGKDVTIDLPGDINMLEMFKTDPVFVSPFMPAVVDSVIPGMAADKAGMRSGDRITALNGKAIDSYNTFTYEVSKLGDVLALSATTADSMKVRTATLVFERDGVADTAQVLFSSDLKLGYISKHWAALYPSTKVEYGFLESFPAGISYGWNVLTGYVDDLKYVFTADGAKSLGGFGTIGSLFPAEWDWHRFWEMTAFLSIILAFMNILPIPALDGGHVLFLLYEIITRRKPSENFMVRAEYVGFAILILLMIVANLNDVLRWLGYM